MFQRQRDLDDQTKEQKTTHGHQWVFKADKKKITPRDYIVLFI